MSRAIVLIALVLGTGAIPVASLPSGSQADALTRLREALGGEAAISAIQTIRARGTTDRKPYKDHIEIKTELPSRFYRTVRYLNPPVLDRRSASESAVFAADNRTTGPGLEGFAEYPGVTMSGFDGLTPLPQRSRFESERRPELPGQILAGAYARFGEFVLPLLGNSSSVYPVSATSDGNSIVFRASGPRWWQLDLDPATNLPTRMSWTTSVPPNPARTAPLNYWQVNFSDFKAVGGLRWPHRLVKSRSGAIEEDTTIDRYDLNIALKFPK
jgi:hypothetical protein